METYKSFLTDSEFVERKDHLQNTWDLNQNRYKACGKLDKSNAEIARRIKQSKEFGSLCLSEQDLEGEEWKPYKAEKFAGLEVSSYGRVRYNKKIVPQKDIKESSVGYLVLDNAELAKKLGGILVYKMVVKVFLEEPPSEGYEIHHITNNGYDNSVGNLIYLTKKQHDIVEHRKKIQPTKSLKTDFGR